jgi:hypothetical protein
MAIWVSAVGAPQIQPPKRLDSPGGCWRSSDAPASPQELAITAAPELRSNRQTSLLGSMNWLLVLCMGGTAWLLVGGLALSLYHRAHSAPIARAAVSAPEVLPTTSSTPAAIDKPISAAVQPPKAEQPVLAEKKPAPTVPPTTPPVSNPSPALTPGDQVVKAPELPTSELTANEELIELKNYGTKLDLVDNPQAAARLALKEKKLLFLLHLSGNFEDDKFT